MAVAPTRGDRRHPAGSIGLDVAALFRPAWHLDRRYATGLFALAAVLRALLPPRWSDRPVGLLDGHRLLPLSRYRPAALSVSLGRRVGTGDGNPRAVVHSVLPV